MFSRSSLLRRPTARGAYFRAGFAGSPLVGGFDADAAPEAGVGRGVGRGAEVGVARAEGVMLPVGVGFLRLCRRWTPGRFEGPGVGVGVGVGRLVAFWLPLFVPGPGCDCGCGLVVDDAVCRAPVPAPRRDAVLGGIVVSSPGGVVWCGCLRRVRKNYRRHVVLPIFTAFDLAWRLRQQYLSRVIR